MPTYKIIGKRYLRKYTASEATPVYAAATDAARIVSELCNVPWEASAVRQAEMPPHGDESNPQNREKFDAALFCAGHGDNMHRAYANAAVYRYTLPAAAVGKTLTGLTVRVTSDPYNAAGARVHVFTGETGEIPTNCRTVRGDGDDGQPLADGTVAAGVAPRETKTIKGQDYWYPVTAEASLAPTGGLVMQKYLFVAVVLESYGTTRGNWLEGASFAENLVSLTLSEAVTGWTDGQTYDLSEDAARSFVVVSGGVMAALPAGDSGVRALTIQRTGDDFVGRQLDFARSKDVRLLKNVNGVPTFEALLSWNGEKSGYLDVIPSGSSTSYEYTFGSSTIKVEDAFSTVTACGSFQERTFEEFPGVVYGLRVNTDVDYQTKVSLKLDRVILSRIADNVARLGSLVKAISDHGGLRHAYVITHHGPGDAVFGLYLCTEHGYFAKRGSGTFDPVVNVTWATNPTAATIEDFEYRDAGGDVMIVQHTAQVLENGRNVYTGDLPCLFVHDRDSKAIRVVFNSVGVSYVGDITAIRPYHAAEYNAPSIIVSGELQSVGGVACKNCAIVNFKNANKPVVTVPAFDADITPDTYDSFAVSASYGWDLPSDLFFVTGRFVSLGSRRFVGAAKIIGNSLVDFATPDGAAAPSLFVAGDTVGGADTMIWYDDQARPENETVMIYDAPTDAVTDEQAAFGLRRLYAALYGGSLHAPAVAAEKRPGAAFVIHGDEIKVKTEDGDVAAKCWNLSASALMIPFSCPRDWAASRIRLAWGAVAATEGSRVRVWLARGKYLTAYPTNYPTDLYLGASSRVGDWELVGEITPTDGEAGTAMLDVKPIMTDVATLMFVAFIGQDDINPSDGMTIPRGVGSLNVNAVVGTATGLDGGFRPDITLIG